MSEEEVFCPHNDLEDMCGICISKKELDGLQILLSQEQALRVNEYANAKRLIDWLNDPNRKPANLAFTEGPERQVAYVFEIINSQEQARSRRYRVALEQIEKHPNDCAGIMNKDCLDRIHSTATAALAETGDGV